MLIEDKWDDILNDIENKLEYTDWSVDMSFQDDDVFFEFSIYSSMGQDFICTVYVSVDDDMSDLVDRLADYYDDFDPDEEASKWVDETGHGTNGAPYRFSDIVKDMEECQEEVYNLTQLLKEIPVKEYDTTK